MSSGMGRRKTVTATIASGDATGLSAAVDLLGYRIGAISLPAGFDGAVLTFQANTSQSGSFGNLYDDAGNEIAGVAAADGRHVGIDAIEKELRIVRWLHWVKFRCGSLSAPATPGADRTITIYLEE